MVRLPSQLFFFDRAFRAFFLGGSLFTGVAMLIWFWQYPAAMTTFSGIPSMYWHAHEMVFGYALATVTGFLLTAVMNWSRENSASGWRLAWVFACWALARIGFLLDWPLIWVATFDLLFNLGLLWLFIGPVLRQKLWPQMGLASKFTLLLAANGVFYAGAFNWLDNGVHMGVIFGLFMVLAINLTMMRRLIPFFTEKALGLPENVQSKRLDALALVGFLALMVAAVFFPQHWATSLIAFPLAGVHFIRLKAWYHPRIWSVLLLWPLHVSYAFMVTGMALYGLVGLGWVSESIALHALAAGGIGLLCSSIMARISLGHTNRNVFEPPKSLVWVFALLAVSAVLRVAFPLLLPEYTVWWVQASQLGWSLAFLWLTVLYLPILARPSRKPNSGILL